MKTIILKPIEAGRVAVIDDDDFERCSKIEWRVVESTATDYAVGYVRKMGNVLLHRFVMDAAPGSIVDHIDHDGLNCQKNNLRFATIHQNAANRRRRAGSIGVSQQESGKWKAQISNKGQVEIIGYFDTKAEAIEAYDLRCVELRGEFAYTNDMAENAADLPPRHFQLICGQRITVDYLDYAQVRTQHWVKKFLKAGGVSIVKSQQRLRDQEVSLGHFILRCPKTAVIKHKNGNLYDFRRLNLEVIQSCKKPNPRTQNRKSGASGYRGVTKKLNKWVPQIHLSDGKRLTLGEYDTVEEARMAYWKAKFLIYGKKVISECDPELLKSLLADASKGESGGDNLEYHI